MTEFQDVERIMLPPQEELLYAAQPYTAYVGGVGSGKTIGGAIKGLNIQTNYPGAWGMVTAPSHNVLNGATIPCYEQIFTPHYIEGFNRQTKEMTLIDGGKVLFRTTKEPWLLEGPSLAWFHMDEAAKSPVLAFQNLQARLRQRIQVDGKEKDTPMQGWVTTSPLGFANWIYWEFGKQERDNYRLINTSTKDNFLAPKHYLERLIESYAHNPQFAIQQLDGKFTQVGGACPFNMEILNDMYEQAKDKQPLKKEISNFIYVYHRNVIGQRYIIGADAASGVGDDESAFVCAQVSPVSIDPVCCGRRRIPEVEFADVLYQKSKEYNNALIVVEDAPIGKATLLKLQDMGANILKTKDKPGVSVTTTKPLFVEQLREAIENRTLSIPHLDMLEQLMSYLRDEKGKFGAGGGGRDDYVSALMMLVQGVRQLPLRNTIRVINTLEERDIYA